MENIKTYEELLKENEELKQRNNNQYETLTRYKNIISENINLNRKIDKAIKYIKQLDYTIDGIIYNKKTQQCIGIDELLDILRGEDNDSKRNV